MHITPTTPIYTLAEAAMLTRLGVSKLSYWIRGGSGKPPVIRVGRDQLSLVNLVELHMVSMFRDEHGISLQSVRRALGELANLWPNEQHPLLTKQYMTDGRDILIRIDGQLVSLIERGQMSFNSVVESYAKRVEWNGQVPHRFFPWTVNSVTEADPANLRRSVVTDPRVQFGRPVIDGTRVTTKAIKDLWDVGTDAHLIAEEFEVSNIQVQDAVRLEELRKATRKAG